MLGRMKKDENEEGSVPSWLQDENQNKSPTRRFFRGRTTKNSVSYGSTSSAVQEDYGGGGGIPMPTENPPPPPTKITSPKEDNAEPAWLHSDNVQKEQEVESEEESEEEESEEEESEEESEEEEEESEEEESEEDDEESRLLSPDWSEDRKKKSRKKSLKNRKPGRNCCHSFFVLVQMVAICCNLAMIAVQLVPIYFWHKMVLEQKVVRGYVALFDIIFIFAELEIFKGLNNWIVRGLVYSFVGVLALDQRVSMIHYGFLNAKTSTSFGQTWNELWTTIFIEASSWSMIGIGSLYVLMEVFCMKRLRNKYRAEYQKKMKEYKKSMQKSK